jgi:hypothetical protein
LLFISAVVIISCNQSKILDTQAETATTEDQPPNSKDKKQHPYGGWFCPDNFGGFPPVDIQDLATIPVVKDRLPTQEETRNGTSLMYFDPVQVPDAHPLAMTLPRVARIYSSHNDINELVIVIQAVVIGKDTVVGFRYPNGGNGTAWIDDVSFLSDQEVDEVGSLPYVYINSEIRASKEKIWQAFARTAYAKKLGLRFDQNEFFNSQWTEESTVHLNDEAENSKAVGIITTLWGNMYLQIDYDNGGFHYSEKMLVMENEGDQTAQVFFVSGPYPKDVAAQSAIWNSWFDEVKTLSETY